MARVKVLVIDDEVGIRFGMRAFLTRNGYAVEEADSCRSAEDTFRAAQPDAVIADFRLPDGTGLDLLPRLRAIDADVPIIMLTAHGSIDLAVRAIKEGAEQFLTKPIELPALLVVLERALEHQRNRLKQLAGLAQRGRGVVYPFLGTSAVIRQLAEDARRVAPSESSILIRGETGAGKGILAHWLHINSPRAEEAFVDLNCAGLSRELLETELFGHEKGAFTGAASSKPGLLEIAHRGTVFLDEIGDMDLQVQPKLLKVLEDKRIRRLGSVSDRRVDLRLISATHQDLARCVGEQTFRGDLYFRLNTIPLVVPALRERPEDIAPLAHYLLNAIAADVGRGHIELSAPAEAALRTHEWPGNIRELRNVLERAVLLSKDAVLHPTDLRFDSLHRADAVSNGPPSTLLEVERRHIEHVLANESGQVAMAAKRLGIPKSTLYQKLKKLGIAVR